ncbi:PLP-dependent aminotransferase family protein [Falsibacillus pallidus]|uniref:MocR-like pyridoxine biosynthesis transcription factor PdxR n=1 Tax=Falsibacillus pallidus TaxID=493781 RepID=UPI003D994423
MAKQTLIAPIIFKEGGVPLYEQLYQHIRQEIITGRLKEGVKLPSIRSLSEKLKISKTTVENAYSQLAAEGYVRSKEKSGLFVEKLDTSFFHGEGTSGESRDGWKKSTVMPELDFNYSLINPDLFPIKDFEKAHRWALSNFAHFQYGDHFGEWPLRNLLSTYLRETRGVDCEADQIIIGAGTRYLIGLLVHALELGNASVGYEDPGFDGVRAYLQWSGVKTVPINVDEEGLSIEELRQTNPKAVYTTPAHQFPTGAIMPISRRIELLQWADRTGGYIIEDDFDGEFRYVGRPIPSLQSLDRNERVIYMGSFSKALSPALKISFMVLPKHLANLFRVNLRAIGQTSSGLMQAILYYLIREGKWHRHLNRARKAYERKYHLLFSELQNGFPQSSSILGSDAGFHMLFKLPGFSEEEIIEKANEHGIKFYPTAPFWHNKEDAPGDTILLGFGGLSEKEIKAGIAVLRKIIESWSG